MSATCDTCSKEFKAISSTVARQALEALLELAELMEDIRIGIYAPDTFTAQPARDAIAALEAALEEKQ